MIDSRMRGHGSINVRFIFYGLIIHELSDFGDARMWSGEIVCKFLDNIPGRFRPPTLSKPSRRIRPTAIASAFVDGAWTKHLYMQIREVFNVNPVAQWLARRSYIKSLELIWSCPFEVMRMSRVRISPGLILRDFFFPSLSFIGQLIYQFNR